MERWYRKRYRRCRDGKCRRIGPLTRIVIWMTERNEVRMQLDQNARLALHRFLNGTLAERNSRWDRCYPVEKSILESWYTILGFFATIAFVYSLGSCVLD